MSVDMERRRRKRGLFRAMRVAAVVLGTALIGLFFSEIRRVSAICPKCLQGASILQVRVGGIPIFQWTRHGSHTHLNPSWSGAEFTVPNEIRPLIYREILGEKCRHKMKKDGFGATSATCFLGFGVCSDGAYPARRLYQPRIEAVAVLYSVFRDVPSKPLAQQTYALIDSLLRGTSV